VVNGWGRDKWGPLPTVFDLDSKSIHLCSFLVLLNPTSSHLQPHFTSTYTFHFKPHLSLTQQPQSKSKEYLSKKKRKEAKMPTLYEITIPVFIKQLTTLSKLLEEGVAHAKDSSNAVTEESLVDARLIADMQTLAYQSMSLPLGPSLHFPIALLSPLL
jgi:hypothetical protein